MSDTLLVRADAGRATGTGHVMRCLALAEGWLDRGGAVVFIGETGSRSLAARLRSNGIEPIDLGSEPGSDEDAHHTCKVAGSSGARWVVLDGYMFSSRYQALVQREGFKVLVVDDNGDAGPYHAELILNQNIHAHASLYERSPSTRLLLGPRYALLRREFRHWRHWRRTVPADIRSLLVTLGGSDPANLTARVVGALRPIGERGSQIKVVLGPANPHASLLRRELASFRNLYLLHAPPDMPSLMAEADIAVSAAGSTCWELAFMGLPSILLAVAENQRTLAGLLARLGCATDLGWHEAIRPREVSSAVESLASDLRARERMAVAGPSLVDGEGVDRAVMWLRGIPLRVRPVRVHDCRLLWTWVPDAEVRSASSAQLSTFEAYARWFEQKMGDSNCVLLLGVDPDDRPVGQIRFELDAQGEASVEVSVAREAVWSDLGTALIREGIRELRRRRQVAVIHAAVRPDNPPTIRAFEASGFRHVGVTGLLGHPAVHYINEDWNVCRMARPGDRR